MTSEQLIQLTIARRTAAGLGLRVFGAAAERDGACERQYARDAAQLAAWIESAKRRGYEFQIIKGG